MAALDIRVEKLKDLCGPDFNLLEQQGDEWCAIGKNTEIVVFAPTPLEAMEKLADALGLLDQARLQELLSVCGSEGDLRYKNPRRLERAMRLASKRLKKAQRS